MRRLWNRFRDWWLKTAITAQQLRNDWDDEDFAWSDAEDDIVASLLQKGPGGTDE